MLLVILTLSMLLVSCKKDPVTDPTNSDPTTTTPGNTDDPNRVAPEVKDFGKYEFKFMMDLQTDYEVQVPEEVGNDGINKALVERNNKVAELYNVKISEKRNTYSSTDAAFTYLKNMNESGDYFADIYSNYAIKMIQNHSVAGVYLNVCELDSLRLDEEWWDQDFVEEFKINNHLYTLTGDIQTNDDLHEIFTSMNLTLYNQTYPEKNFYEIVVKNGAWTWDEFYNTWYGFGSNDGGQSGVVDADDKVAYYYDCRTVSYMYMASGLKAFTMVNNKPELTISSGKALTICVDRMQQILDGHSNFKSVRLDDSTVRPDSYSGGNLHFASGKVLFISCNFTDALQYQLDMEHTVVYPPFPKYEGGQERYYSLVHKDFEPIAISSQVRDKERTALLTEALCFYSDKLEEEVMKVLLRERLTAEPETRMILQLTLDSKVYDMEYTANIMGWTGMVNDTLFTKNQLTKYSEEAGKLANQAINTRGTGTLENFLKAYAGLNYAQR